MQIVTFLETGKMWKERKNTEKVGKIGKIVLKME